MGLHKLRSKTWALCTYSAVVSKKPFIAVNQQQTQSCISLSFLYTKNDLEEVELGVCVCVCVVLALWSGQGG